MGASPLFPPNKRIEQMELTENCKILLDKGTTQKVKCYKFCQTDFNRELAVHEHADHKTLSTISDVATGMRLCGIGKEIKKVTAEDIDQAIIAFTRHFTLEGILKRFEELDKNLVPSQNKWYNETIGMT